MKQYFLKKSIAFLFITLLFILSFSCFSRYENALSTESVSQLFFSFDDTITNDSARYEIIKEIVWIPTRGGTKYHSTSSCSRMIEPDYVSLSEAKQKGFTPCKNCF